MKNRKTKIQGNFSALIVGIICGITILAINATKWLNIYVGDVSFATILYQMRSPLKGTDSNIVSSFIEMCFVPAIGGAVVLSLVYDIAITVKISIAVMVFNKKLLLSIARKWRKRFFIISETVISFIIIYVLAQKVGLIEYMQQISQKTEIYEEYYVSPNDVLIKFPEKKRNLILIYLESMESTYASELEGGGMEANYIPNLTQIADENINFSNTDKLGGAYCVTGTGWTMGALMGSSSGIPFSMPVGGNEMNKYFSYLPGLITLGDILEDAGYNQEFLCGSDGEFAGRALYYQEHGNYKICDYFWAVEQGHVKESEKSGWGYQDAKLYELAKGELMKLAEEDQPFNLTMITVDTHFPDGHFCESCENIYSEQYANVINCADRKITEFISWLSEQEFYDNTTIVLLGDHITMQKEFFDDIGRERRRIYNCFINASVTDYERTNIKNREFTTLDYFPTILASMGVLIEGERLNMGTNLFSEVSTISEKIGLNNFENELKKYSSFYGKTFY